MQHHHRAVFISMLGICCKLLINTWRKTLPLLSDAAAAQGLLFDPAGFSPWWAISHFPLALELFILFVITKGICGEKFLLCSPSSSTLGQGVCSFFALLCPKPLLSSPEPDDILEEDSLIHPHHGTLPSHEQTLSAPVGHTPTPLLPSV